MNNRRNYYRILHVQPDAPLEIIKSSYRTLMHKLRQHPDLGGDNENAALLNDAYAVLSDSEKRKQYDANYTYPTINDLREGNNIFSGIYQNDPAPREPKQRETTKSSCPFCKSPIHFEIYPEVRCLQCESPLSPVTTLELEQFGQRQVTRILTNSEITFFTRWPQSGLLGQVQDLSPSGMRFITNTPLSINSVIKIKGKHLDSVAQITNYHKLKKALSPFYSIGIKFLTLEFHQKTGAFVSSHV